MCASLRSWGRVALDVEAIAQAQRAKLVLAEAPREEAARLVAELLDALGDERPVVVVVAIHGQRGEGAFIFG